MFKRLSILGSASCVGSPRGAIPTGIVGMLALSLSLALDLGLAGCGQKGPLYLPAPNATTKAAKSPASPPSPSASAPASEAARP